jgi:hypothetical protein
LVADTVTDEHLVRAVVERCEGNPLFATELAASVAGQAGLPAGSLPATIEGVLTARLDRLPARSLEVLQLAGAIGVEAPLPVLRQAARSETFGADLEILRTEGFLTDEPGRDAVVFEHALVHDATYGRVLRRRRRELHQKVAAAAEAVLGAGDDHVAFIARQHYLARSPEAVPLLMRSAAIARALFATEEAIAQLRWAQELAAELRPDLLAEVETDLAELVELQGDYGEALSLWSHVRDLSGSFRAWKGLASVHRSRGDFAAARALLVEAGEVSVRANDELAQLWFERGRTSLVASRIDEGAAAFRAGLMLPGVSDVVEGQLLAFLAQAEMILDDLEGALQHAGIAVERLRRT